MFHLEFVVLGVRRYRLNRSEEQNRSMKALTMTLRASVLGSQDFGFEPEAQDLPPLPAGFHPPARNAEAENNRDL